MQAPPSARRCAGRLSFSVPPGSPRSPPSSSPRRRRLALVAEVLNGSCLCGGVRFEVTEPPVSASYCHCTRCQKRTGTAASPQARIVPGSLRITAGEDLVRAYEPPDGFPKAFCSACGSALWSVNPHTNEIAVGPHERLRRRPRRPALVPAVRDLRGRVGADSGRRPSTAPGRQSRRSPANLGR